MARLIDADALKSFYASWSDKNTEFIKAEVDRFVDLQITVDAEPVIHGHWINRRNSVYCSRCGKGYRNGVGTISALNHNYCPNCGAKMDEVSE